MPVEICRRAGKYNRLPLAGGSRSTLWQRSFNHPCDCGSCHPARESRSSALRLPWSSGGPLVAARRLRNSFRGRLGAWDWGGADYDLPPKGVPSAESEKTDPQPLQSRG